MAASASTRLSQGVARVLRTTVCTAQVRQHRPSLIHVLLIVAVEGGYYIGLPVAVISIKNVDVESKASHLLRQV